jgi:hypothetical protein
MFAVFSIEATIPMEISPPDKVDISAEKISHYFAAHVNHLHIRVVDYGWCKNIYFPDIAPNLSRITIERTSGWDTFYHIGLKRIKIERGHTRTYFFKNQQWNLIPTTVPMEISPKDGVNISAHEITEYLENDIDLTIRMINGGWCEHVYFPNIAPEHSRITVQMNAYWDESIFHVGNNEIRVERGKIQTYIFKDGQWSFDSEAWTKKHKRVISIFQHGKSLADVYPMSIEIPDSIRISPTRKTIYRSEIDRHLKKTNDLQIDIKNHTHCSEVYFPYHAQEYSEITIERESSKWNTRFHINSEKIYLGEEKHRTYIFLKGKWNFVSDARTVYPDDQSEMSEDYVKTLLATTKHLIVISKDGNWAIRVYLPSSFPHNRHVSLHRTSQYETYANIGLNYFLLNEDVHGDTLPLQVIYSAR